MALRRKSRIATVKCATELTTMLGIAESSGLEAERADAPDQFHILNSGRILASEMKFALWTEMTARLDQAVRIGRIPSWSHT
jgi:hypothetical protein